MTNVTSIRPIVPQLPNVVGYVEALTADRILGWAWAPASPNEHVMIELYMGEAMVANVVADLPRTDLANNGIGDGRHAFDIEIPQQFRGQKAELRVLAHANGGEAMAIGAPPAADGMSDQITKLLRGMDMLLNSQRLIHRNLQTVLTVPKEAEESSVAATLNRLADLQTETAAQVTATERFVIRLDEHLSRLSAEEPDPVSKAGRFPSVSLWALGVAAIALIVSVVGLVRSLGG